METSEKGILEKRLTRRSFLKGAAGAAAATGLATSLGGCQMLRPATKADRQHEEKVFAGVCRGNCFNACFLNVHVRDGKVVRTSARDLPRPDYNRICAKGLTMMHRMYSAERLKYPLKRVGARGEGRWQQISWEEAIDTIASKWVGYQRDFGNDAFAVLPGSGNWASLNGVTGGQPLGRLRRVSGSSFIHFAVDEAMFRIGRIATGAGLNYTLNEPADLRNAKTIICWGANPPVSQKNSMHFIMDAIEKGAKYIVIDPVSNFNSSLAHIHVPIRAGSDGALALAMMNIVIREGWQDLAFLRASTVAPFLVKETDGTFLRLSDLGRAAAGANDAIVVRDANGNFGIPAEITNPVLEGTFTVQGIRVTTAYTLLLRRIAEYPPARAAEICRIPVSVIEEITRIYATETPSTIYQSFGINHYVNAHYSLLCIFALSMLTGNMGKEGSSSGFSFFIGGRTVNAAEAFFPSGSPGPGRTFVITQVGELLDTGMYGQTPATLKGAYLACINPPATMAERRHILDWMRKIDFLAVADFTLTEAAQNADIVLPAAHWFEVVDVNLTSGTNPHFLWQDKAVEPAYGTKSDFEIVNLLAHKMGLGHFFDMNEEEYLRMLFNSDTMRALGVTYERLSEQKAIRGLPGDNFVSFAGGVFPTPTGRMHFYQERLVPEYDHGQAWDIEKERLPYWEPPNEAWSENPLHARFPFHFVTSNSMLRTHSQWWEVPLLMEIVSEPYVEINPNDAARFGITDGDLVRVHNDRGHVVLRAKINNGMQPGMLVHPRGWEACQYISGNAQDLTSRVINPVNANQAFYDVLAAIERV